MKFVTYNVHFGIGLDGRFDLDRLAASVADGDIIALQEVTRNFMGNGGADMVAGLAERLPDHFHVFAPAMDVDFGARGNDGRPINRRLEFGNMILSRWPILSCRNHLLPRTRRFDRGNLQRAALEALVNGPAGAFRVYATHLDHVNLEERIAQIHHLRDRINAYPMEGGAITGAAEYGFPEPPCPEDYVLMGDLNLVRGSPEHSALTGSIDPVEGRQRVAHYPVDAFDLAGGVADGTVSFVGNDDSAGHRLIDFILVHAMRAAKLRGVWVDATAEGSDHLPVWAEMD